MLCSDPTGVEPLRGRAGAADTPDVVFVTSCITSSDGHPLAMLRDDKADPLRYPEALGRPTQRVKQGRLLQPLLPSAAHPAP